MRALLIALATAVISLSATAQKPNQRITARAYQPVPETAMIAIRPPRANAMDERLENAFRQALTDAGRQVADGPDAALELYFDYWESGPGAGALNNKRTFGEFSGDSDRGVDFKLNLWDSEAGGILNDPKADKAPTHGARLTVELRRGPDVLWIAQAVVTGIKQSPEFALEDLVYPTVELLGQDAAPEN